MLWPEQKKGNFSFEYWVMGNKNQVTLATITQLIAIWGNMFSSSATNPPTQH